MAYNQLVTKNGHKLSEMSNLLQKAIRRGNVELAGYAANEMFGRYHAYLWRRLLMISAEDCYGVITKEIVALKQADDEFNAKRKGYEKEKLFVAKALTLLLYCKKNRDACYIACNYMLSERILKQDEYVHLDDCKFDGVLPDYCCDCHSYEGKRRGKTVQEFIETEEAALGGGVGEKRQGMFDDKPWTKFLETTTPSGGYGKIDEDRGYPVPTAKDLKALENGDYDTEASQQNLFDDF